tara:strand:+ start:882 stop:1862 length:981 start_codon:yes stop_codon:yes gene_type:complete
MLDIIDAYFSLKRECKVSETKEIDQNVNSSPGLYKDFKSENYEQISLLTSEWGYNALLVEILDDLKDADWGEQIKFECEDLKYFNHLQGEDVKRPDLSACSDRYEDIFNENELPETEFTTCAWYSSYHYGHKNWGIHIKQDCLLNRAKLIWRYNYPYTLTKEDAIKSAFLYTFSHELFHLIVDQAVTLLEIILKDPDIYIKYFSNVYKHTHKTYPDGALEEALANRYRFGRYKFYNINKGLARAMMKKQPAGYNRFDEYLGSKFKKGKDELLNLIITQNVSHSKSQFLPLSDIFNVLDVDSFHSKNLVPVYIHYKHSKKLMFKLNN